MFLRKETEGYNDNCGKYFGNCREKMHVLNKEIQDQVIEANINSNDKHITEQLGLAAQIRCIKNNVFI